MLFPIIFFRKKKNNSKFCFWSYSFDYFCLIQINEKNFYWFVQRWQHKCDHHFIKTIEFFFSHEQKRDENIRTDITFTLTHSLTQRYAVPVAVCLCLLNQQCLHLHSLFRDVDTFHIFATVKCDCKRFYFILGYPFQSSSQFFIRENVQLRII